MNRPLSFFLFIIAAVAVIALMHRALWGWLVRDTKLPARAHRIGTLTFIGLALLAPVGWGVLLLVRTRPAQLFTVGIFTWLALALVLFSVLVVLRVPPSVVARVKQFDPARRLFLSRAAAGTATLVTAGAGVSGVKSATDAPIINEVPVRLARLPKALSGFTIAQISDLHVGPTIREREVLRVVDAINALKPDLVAITGDLVDGSVEQLGFATQHLGNLKARFGTYFVTGNHEYYSGVDDWKTELTRLGITVLGNSRVSIGDAASFDLAGVDDYAGAGGPAGTNASSDLGTAVEGRDPERALVLLAHQPRRDFVASAVKAQVDLQLSGHTHGGQLMPFNLVVGAMFPYLAGLYAVDATQVFVSRGTGYWGPPLRIGYPPEISKLVLTT
ncbi:MAG: metallophosphoesterase [Myxococcaceae bacterium]|nr:metallophosphoesterase [Myxococcaceae bacterium]